MVVLNFILRVSHAFQNLVDAQNSLPRMVVDFSVMAMLISMSLASMVANELYEKDAIIHSIPNKKE